jgi:DNA-binding transcriptional regulator YhcF (GntR family)
VKVSSLFDDVDISREGWIKVHRAILLHPVFQDSELLHVFLYCLAKANHKPGRVLSPQSAGGELKIERGQFIFGQRKAAKDTGINARTAHRKMVLLEKLGILTRSVSHRFTVVTVNNYARYQDNPNQPDPLHDSSVSHPCPKSVRQVSTNKNKKNEKNDKKKIYQSHSVEYELSQFLLAEIRKNDHGVLVNNPEAEEATLQRWSSDFNQLMGIDARPQGEIKKLIEFAQASSFWRSIVLSARELREKYTSLLLQMKSQQEYSEQPRNQKKMKGETLACEIVI